MEMQVVLETGETRTAEMFLASQCRHPCKAKEREKHYRTLLRDTAERLEDLKYFREEFSAHQRTRGQISTIADTVRRSQPRVVLPRNTSQVRSTGKRTRNASRPEAVGRAERQPLEDFYVSQRNQMLRNDTSRRDHEGAQILSSLCFPRQMEVEPIAGKQGTREVQPADKNGISEIVSSATDTDESDCSSDDLEEVFAKPCAPRRDKLSLEVPRNMPLKYLGGEPGMLPMSAKGLPNPGEGAVSAKDFIEMKFFLQATWRS